MHATVTKALEAIRSWIVAYYKKEFVSTANHPPMQYYIEVSKIPAHPANQTKVLGIFRVSPDLTEQVAEFPRDLTDTRGFFYETGFGTVELDHAETRATCCLEPGPDLSITKTVTA